MKYTVIYGAYIRGIFGREIAEYKVIYGAYIHGNFGREITKYTVIYGAYIRSILANPTHFQTAFELCLLFVKVRTSVGFLGKLSLSTKAHVGGIGIYIFFLFQGCAMQVF